MRRLPKRDVRKLVSMLERVEGIESAVLYGSVARGDYGPNSDMDVLIVVEDENVSAEVQEMLASAALPRRVQPTIRTKEQLEETDFGLLRNIFQQGLVLFSRNVLDLPAAGLLHLKPQALFTFELRGIKQKEKARFNRALYQNKEDGEAGGLLARVGGRKLGRGSILVPAGAAKDIEKLFKKFGVAAERTDAWV